MNPSSAHMQIRPVGAIPAPVWDEVWDLSRRFYQAERAYVEAKLREQHQLALFRSKVDDSLVGMAAIRVDPLDFQGRPLVVIFTSHAIVDENYRGQNLIQRAGVRTFLQCCLRHPLRRKYWAFDTFSYKSYWLLPRNLREFWPRRDRPTPAWQAALMEHYGRLTYGDAWRGGVVQGSAHKRLLPQTAALNAALMKDPDLAFFAHANPGHACGDMLLCLCPLSFSNWWSILSRAVTRSLRTP